jgi:putative colanic acid biosynthesis acetyltransferase WcaF
VKRLLWGVVSGTLFRWSPRWLFGWRRMLLNLFGAKVDRTARVYPSCRVLMPWNLEMAAGATLANDVDCYNVSPVRIGARTVISQLCYLCPGSHDFEDPRRPITYEPITIGSDVWIAADVFVGPGVTIGDGAVVGARAGVFKDLPAWTVCVGMPAKPVRKREMKGEGTEASRHQGTE